MWLLVKMQHGVDAPEDWTVYQVWKSVSYVDTEMTLTLTEWINVFMNHKPTWTFELMDELSQ